MITSIGPEQFEREYPQLYKGNYISFDLQPGWQEVLHNLSRSIVTLLANQPLVAAKFRVLQVKDKFGSLRFYYTPHDRHIQMVVDAAENASKKLCFGCGERGTQKQCNGVLVTACDSCVLEQGGSVI